MSRILKIAITAIFALTVFVGCRTSAIYNVEASNFAAPKNTKLAKIEKAIIVAGTRLGWKMKKIRPGELQGSLFIRNHMAKVKIPYDLKKYSILYLDSSNLKYNAEDKTIHSNYNGWVQNLDNAIQAELTVL